jgi:hypothetical protein
MDTEETKELTVIEGQNWEPTTHEGKPARYFPRSGAVMVYSDEYKRWIIRANRGGRSDFDPYELVEAKMRKRKQAIMDGLEAAAWELDLRTASAVLAAIVEARAKNAIEDEGRTGNADAKFIFSLIGDEKAKTEDGPSLRMDMDAEVAKEFIGTMKEVMRERQNE